MAGDSAHPAAASSENAIEVRGLTKQYGDVLAVGGIDLDVRRGECFALLGPNGAGKTTTVEIIEGFRPRTAGYGVRAGRGPGARAPGLAGSGRDRAAGHR